MRTKSLGFLDSPNRLNVAITRARNHLIIFGNVGLFGQSDMWKVILKEATMRKTVFSSVEDLIGLLHFCNTEAWSI